MPARLAVRQSAETLTGMAMLGRAITGFTLCLLAACSERVPETTLDGIYSEAQAQRGEGLYAQHCARCHSEQEFTGRMFATVWGGTPAAALYLRIANTMPMDQPGSLGTEQVSALVAHILALNGMPSGESALTGDLERLRSITIAQPASRPRSGD